MVDTPTYSRGWGCDKLVSEQDLRKPVLYTIVHYWQPCIFEFKVHTYQVIQSIKQLILADTTLCQEEDVEVVPGESFQRFPSVLQYLAKRDEHVVSSTTASMNQPPAAGRAGPSEPPKGAQVPGLFTEEQVAQIAQIVAIAARQQPQPPPPPREVLEEPGRSIERAQKLKYIYYS